MYQVCIPKYMQTFDFDLALVCNFAFGNISVLVVCIMFKIACSQAQLVRGLFKFGWSVSQHMAHMLM